MTVDAVTLLKRLHHLGVTVMVNGDHLRLKPGSRLTPDLVAALRELKPQVLAELDKERQDSFYCWVLEEWRYLSIPQWRRILEESIEQGDKSREEYARWMLREVLLDPEYKETGHEHIG
jgi:hypothetical protein